MTKADRVDTVAATLPRLQHQTAVVVTLFLPGITDALRAGTTWHCGGLGASGSATARRAPAATPQRATPSRCRPHRSSGFQWRKRPVSWWRPPRLSPSAPARGLPPARVAVSAVPDLAAETRTSLSRRQAFAAKEKRPV